MQRKRMVSVVGVLLGVFLVAAAALPMAQAVGTETFNNTVDSYWDTAGNWSGDGSAPPADSDAVIINGNVTNFWTSTANLASYTLNNGFTHTFVGTNVFLKATTVTINGTLTHSTNMTGAAVGGVWYPDSLLQIQATDVTIGSGGKIDVNSKGYAGSVVGYAYGFGPGGGYGYANHGDGAGHGGSGGVHGGSPNGAPYDSVSAPIQPGSGGGNCNGTAEPGGTGGGAVRIDASGIVQVDGTISANGSNLAPYGPYGAGGGSGGSVYITCATLKGSGTIRADGSDGYNRGWSSGGGGGGRIAVLYSAANSVTIRFSARNGISYGPGIGDYVSRGEVGTLYLSDNSFLPGSLQGNYFNLQIPSFTSWTPSSLTVTGACVRLQSNLNVTVAGDLVVGTNGTLMFGEHSTVQVTGNLIVTNGGSLYVYSGITNGTWVGYGSIVTVHGATRVANSSAIYPVSHPTSVGTPKFVLGDVSVASGAAINANGSGYWSKGTVGYGIGGGGAGGNEGAGGGHGGRGGDARSGYAVYGGGTYGDETAPVTAGSGGGDCDGYTWADHGGGAVRIQALGAVVTIDGTIMANGLVATNFCTGEAGAYNGYGSGGGAGGGIYIECKKIQGSGVITANGSNGGAAGFSGGGGGGRVAIWRQLDNWAGLALTTNNVVAGGTNTSGLAPGTNGTLFFGSIPIVFGTVIMLQ